MTNKKNVLSILLNLKQKLLSLLKKVGVAAAARQLSLHESQNYGWRKAANKNSSTTERGKRISSRYCKARRQLAEKT
ncbi:hypothetical protein FXE87_10065 [Vibrio mimicus]|nr:hypothetical protein FXE87_10065 [Vibrio mimicus]